MPDNVDHESRRLAEKALERIDGHIDTCTERWNESRKSQQRIEHQIETRFTDADGSRARLHSRIDEVQQGQSKAFMTTLVQALLILLAIIGFLVRETLFK